MSALPIAARSFADRRRGLLFWSVGVGAYVATMLAFFPTARSQAQSFNQLLENYPKGMLTMFVGSEKIDFGSAPSFLNTYLYASMVPIIVLVLAIGFGAAAIAGEEEAGTLDLVLAHPVSRRSVVLQKALVLPALLTTVGAVIVLLVVGAVPLLDMDLSVGNLVAATVALVLLATDLGLVALAVGAATGRRGLAAGVAGGVAAGTYLVNSMSSLATWLEPWRVVSPFYWASHDNPLANGLAPGRLVVLVVLGSALLGVAVVAFERRDLRG